MAYHDLYEGVTPWSTQYRYTNEQLEQLCGLTPSGGSTVTTSTLPSLGHHGPAPMPSTPVAVASPGANGAYDDSNVPADTILKVSADMEVAHSGGRFDRYHRRPNRPLLPAFGGDIQPLAVAQYVQQRSDTCEEDAERLQAIALTSW